MLVGILFQDLNKNRRFSLILQGFLLFVNCINDIIRMVF